MKIISAVVALPPVKKICSVQSVPMKHCAEHRL